MLSFKQACQYIEDNSSRECNDSEDLHCKKCKKIKKFDVVVIKNPYDIWYEYYCRVCETEYIED